VGENLQDHLCVAIVYPRLVASRDTEVELSVSGSHERDESGAIAFNVAESAGYVRSSRNIDAPDFIICGVPSAVGPMPGWAGECVAIVGWQAQPLSRGQLRLRSADPDTPPRIRHNYLTAVADQRVLVNGVRRMIDIAAQASFQKLVVGEPINFPQGPSDAAILACARETGTSVHHPCGTCAIGRVVDANLRVYGIDGLRVIDASVMPSIVSGATNAAAVMIGERASDLIRNPRGVG
jgi:choline dehydrogenase-like flavoprotein